jgi:hypothetical protein
MKLTRIKLVLIILFCLLLIPLILFTINKNFTENYETQPLVYTKQKSTVPDACLPYLGCTWPSDSGNPVVYRGTQGYRLPAKGSNEIQCNNASRDCHAYQDCVEGKCIKKI